MKPKRVVFVDDLLKHNETMEKALNKLGIEHHEFRYGAADESVRSFRKDIADVELKVFQECAGDLISDEEALVMMDAGTFWCN